MLQPVQNGVLVTITVALLFAASARRSRIYLPLVGVVIGMAAGCFTWMEVLRQIPLGLSFYMSLGLVLLPLVVVVVGCWSVRAIRD